MTTRDRAPTLAGVEPVVTCEHLTRRFGDRTAVDDVSFSVAPGETYGLLGPNGAGKTTCFYMIVGMIAADRGWRRTRVAWPAG